MAKRTVGKARSRKPTAQEKKAAERWAKFLAELEETGIVKAAARAAGIKAATAYAKRTKDPKFAALWDDALELSTQVLELEARRRAVEGVDQPVYSQGIQVDVIKKYSDQLLMFLLKGRRPEVYRDRKDVKHSGSMSFKGDIATLMQQAAKSGFKKPKDNDE